jgi:hypothetical protein
MHTTQTTSTQSPSAPAPTPSVTAWKSVPPWAGLLAAAAGAASVYLNVWVGLLLLVPLVALQESQRVVISPTNAYLRMTPASRLARLLRRAPQPTELVDADHVAIARRVGLHDTWSVDGRRVTVSVFKRNAMRRMVASASANRDATP